MDEKLSEFGEEFCVIHVILLMYVLYELRPHALGYSFSSYNTSFVAGIVRTI